MDTKFVMVTSNNKKKTIMKYNKLSFTLSAILLFCVNLMMAQSSIRGTVTDSETGEAIPGANVVIIGTSEGTTADFDGNFTLTTDQGLPFKIEITSIAVSYTHLTLPTILRV